MVPSFYFFSILKILFSFRLWFEGKENIFDLEHGTGGRMMFFFHCLNYYSREDYDRHRMFVGRPRPDRNA